MSISCISYLTGGIRSRFNFSQEDLLIHNLLLTLGIWDAHTPDFSPYILVMEDADMQSHAILIQCDTFNYIIRYSISWKHKESVPHFAWESPRGVNPWLGIEDNHSLLAEQVEKYICQREKKP